MLPELREQVRRVLDEVALLPDDGTTSASWAPAKGALDAPDLPTPNW
ncbi:hypothetical protein ACETU7_25635 [Rhodococcus sp. 3Y1]